MLVGVLVGVLVGILRLGILRLIILRVSLWVDLIFDLPFVWAVDFGLILGFLVNLRG